MQTKEEEQRDQEEFNRKADKTSGWISDGCLSGCLPVLAVLLLPLLLVF